MVDKKTFFEELHKKIAQEVGAEVEQIVYIRSYVLGKFRTREQLLDHLVVVPKWPKSKGSKLTQNRLLKNIKQRHYSKVFYQNLLAFLGKCSEKDWENIIQLTKYDKKI